MSRTNRPKALNVSELQVFAAALVKFFGNQTLTINGSSFTAQQFKAKVDAYVALLESATAAKSAWSDQLTALDSAVSELDPLAARARGYVRDVYGLSSSKLSQFGLTPRKLPARSAAQQIVVNEKSAATRTARHTVGPKQKKAIHGTASTPLAPSVKPGGDTK